MSRRYTVLGKAVQGALLCILAGICLAQGAAGQSAWRPAGNGLQLLGLPSPAGGRVDRVWFSADGSGVRVQLGQGEVWGTDNLETWSRRVEAVPQIEAAQAASLPESAARTRARSAGSAVVYAAGRDVWRSVNEGANWENLTGFRGKSILGGRVRDLAVHPSDDERIAVATDTGIWISLDGGFTWAGLNEGLPGFRIRRITGAAEGATGIRVQAESAGEWIEMEWMPGQRAGWIPVSGGRLDQEAGLRRALADLGVEATAVAASGETRFGATANGRLLTSVDGGESWREFRPSAGEIAQIWADPVDGRVALAVADGQAGLGPRVLRTVNGGIYWDDLTANLPPGPVTGVAVDRRTGAVYVALPRGVFWTFTDLRAPAPASAWRPVAGELPAGEVTSVALDRSGTLLLAAIDGYGVFSRLSPHTLERPRVLHSADFSDGEAAPGSLLTLSGSSADRVTANTAEAPVLSSSIEESQFQLPYDLSGDSVRLAVAREGGALAFPLRLKAASPAILADREGTPFVLDAGSGVAIDAMNPLRGGMTIQILATGLGRVTPEWPAGLPAPASNPPRVAAEVKVLIDGVPLEDVEARLAPGYVGFYLIEARLPAMLDSGPAELRVEVGASASGPVRVYVER
ncbi:MAG: hypothetical protein IH602_01275 [Bryobacteraceae bacterium]|nr:hypothetical protein [Bryobacteraceae bacterium]